MSVRTVTDRHGVVWREREKGGGVVERIRIAGPELLVTRPGPPARLVESGRMPARRLPPAKESWRDDVRVWGHPSEEVEFAPDSACSINLGLGVRRQILDEIAWVRKQAGDVEAGGHLWATSRPRKWESRCSVHRATHSGDDAECSYSRFVFGELSSLPESQGGPWKRVGDWHSHCHAGSTMPSRADMRAWAGMCDDLALARYLAIIVLPAAKGGWSYPRFTGWTVEREGSPSRFYCRPAHVW